MPPRIRDLIRTLNGGGSSIEVARAATGTVLTRKSPVITISGGSGDDAKHYQVRAVKRALEESKS